MPESPNQNRVFRFGTYELDAGTGELRKDGKTRPRLQGQPLEILLHLLDHPSEVVTREELRQRLWPADTFVDYDHSLNTAVNKLREALNDSADNPRFIETLPKRGYRFIAPVSASAAPRPHLQAVPPSSAPTPFPVQVPIPAISRDGSSGVPRVSPSAPAIRFHLTRYLTPAVMLLFYIAVIAGWYFYSHSRGGAEQSEIRIAPLNGLPRESDAAFSPDGNQVAFVWAGEKGGNAHIYVSQIGATDSPRQITASGEGTFEFAPVWSPDGRYLAFFRFNDKEK